MATQTIDFPASAGQTLTLKLFPESSDTQTASASATEGTNALGRYRAAFTDIAAGVYRMIALDGSSNAVFSDLIELTLTTDTFYGRGEAASSAGGSVQVSGFDDDAITEAAFVDSVYTAFSASGTLMLPGGSGEVRRNKGDLVTVYVDEEIVVARIVYDADDVPIDLTGQAITFLTWDRKKQKRAEVAATGTATGFSVTVPRQKDPYTGEWFLRKDSTGGVITDGQFDCLPAARISL